MTSREVGKRNMLTGVPRRKTAGHPAARLIRRDKITVGLQLFVAGERVKGLGDCLSDQHPAERITVSDEKSPSK